MENEQIDEARGSLLEEDMPPFVENIFLFSAMGLWLLIFFPMIWFIFVGPGEGIIIEVWRVDYQVYSARIMQEGERYYIYRKWNVTYDHGEYSWRPFREEWWRFWAWSSSYDTLEDAIGVFYDTRRDMWTPGDGGCFISTLIGKEN